MFTPVVAANFAGPEVTVSGAVWERIVEERVSMLGRGNGWDIGYTKGYFES